MKWFTLIRHDESEIKSSCQLGNACLFFHFSQELAVVWSVFAILPHNGSFYFVLQSDSESKEDQ